MKTIRLVLLLAILLIAPPALGRAAGEPPDDPPRVYLPLILKDWRPVSQTRFLNVSGEYVHRLAVDGGAPLVTEDRPLANGESITHELSPGAHTFTVTLGGSDVYEKHYQWTQSFTQEPLRTTVEMIERPSLAAVLSGTSDSMQWENRDIFYGPDEPTRFCFFSDGSYHVYFHDPCPQFGIVEETPATPYTRNFNLVDPDGIVWFNANLQPNTNPLSEYFNLNRGENAWDYISDYRHTGSAACPPVPDECPLSPR